MAKPVIDEATCSKCGACIDACPMDVLEMDEINGPQVSHPSNCVGCRACEQVCPEGAITILEAEA